jgi:replication initiation protein RepC
MIATGIEENVPIRSGAGASDWLGIYTLYRSILARIPRTAVRQQLEPIAEELSLLADEVLRLLEDHVKTKNLVANESRSGQHKQNSNPNHHIELEPAFQKSRGQGVEPLSQSPRMPEGVFPLGLVLDACPDIVDYTRGGIADWRDFLSVAAVVRPMLGISPSAWEEAQAVMGEVQAATVVAAILQRGEAIHSAGGYLRELTERARAGGFSPGPMLMALIGARKRDANEKMTA